MDEELGRDLGGCEDDLGGFELRLGAREVNGVEEGCDAMSCNDGRLQQRREQIYSLAAMI